LLLADQPVRSRAVPLIEAEQFEPGTAVVVVVGVVVLVVVVVDVVVVDVVVVAAEAGEMVGARKAPAMASVTTIAMPGATCQKCRPLRL
jgi:hypothetical protein